MALPRELALERGQIDEIMASQWNLRIASIGPGGRINLTPMWFGWAGGKLYIYGRGQKVVNLRRSPDCTVIVDRNEKFPELQGIMIQGKARVLEDEAAERAEPHLEDARNQMSRKYGGKNESTARGRNRRWIVLVPERTVTWDNFKIKRL